MPVRCAYRKCGREFKSVRTSQIYCRDACRKADWTRRKRRVASALTRAFELLGVGLDWIDVAVIAERLALEWLTGWLEAWAGIGWNGDDFADQLVG